MSADNSRSDSVEMLNTSETASSVSCPPSSVPLQQPVWVSPMETEHGRRVMDDLRKKWAQRRADAASAANALAAPDENVMNKLLHELWSIDN